MAFKKHHWSQHQGSQQSRTSVFFTRKSATMPGVLARHLPEEATSETFRNGCVIPSSQEELYWLRLLVRLHTSGEGEAPNLSASNVSRCRNMWKEDQSQLGSSALFSAGVPEKLIRDVTGHRSSALQLYERPTVEQKQCTTLSERSTHTAAAGSCDCFDLYSLGSLTAT